MALSAATLAVGVWVMTHAHSSARACTAYLSQFQGSSSHVACTQATSGLLVGAGLTMVGAVVLGLASLAVMRHRRRVTWAERAPHLAPRTTHHVVGSTH